MSTQSFAKIVLPRKLGIRVHGYLFVDIRVETAIAALCRQVPLSLTSTALESLFAKCKWMMLISLGKWEHEIICVDCDSLYL